MTRLDPAAHAWLTDAGTQAVLQALDATAPGATRLVGGCVRNALIGAPVDDIDLATRLRPLDVIAALEAAGLKAVPTGIEHGTVTGVAEGRGFEITTLRRDVETDGRNATIAFADTFEEDAARRDFRFNAIYCDGDGALFDPVGGVADALAGRVVFIGDPTTRIAEDRLRILRFFRFNAWYGREGLDPEGLGACVAGAPDLRRLSAERVWKEVKKTLAAPAPGPALRAMAAAEVLERVLPEAVYLDLLDAVLALEAREGWAIDPMVRLIALIPRFSDVTGRVGRRFKMSKAEAGRLQAWSAGNFNPRLLLDAGLDGQRAALYAVDRQAALDRLRLAWAADEARGETGDPARWRSLLAEAEGWSPPPFPLSGDDLIERGVPRGPYLGATLKALESLWARGGFRADRDALLAALEAMRG